MTDIGPFEQATLLALIRLGKDAYGRAILSEVQARLRREVSAGAVYATLERLESKGLASSRLAPGPPFAVAAPGATSCRPAPASAR
jgi:PadR family transcriptional regulator, regulatory protein PadR